MLLDELILENYTQKNSRKLLNENRNFKSIGSENKI